MNPRDIIHSSWSPILGYLHQDLLLEFSTQVLPNSISYPQKENIFRVLKMPIDQIKVVIIGQDPYHGKNQATGLAFAVSKETPTPPSLRIIQQEVFKESPELLDFMLNKDWRTLEHWEKQGVFLYNTALTVESGKPGSHLKYWEQFSRKVLSFIAYHHPTIWLMWGKKAQAFTSCIPGNTIQNVRGYTRETIEKIPISEYKNYVLQAAHPASELYSANAGFLGCEHFYFVNKILSKLGRETINW